MRVRVEHDSPLAVYVYLDGLEESVFSAQRSGESPEHVSTTLEPMSSGSQTEPPVAAVPTSVSPDHRGITELFGVLACGELAAFYRLTSEALMAPGIRGRVAMASMAAAEMAHFETLQDELQRRGVDVYELIAAYEAVLDRYHASTVPSTWEESLVKVYVGDGLAADFYLEIAGTLPPEAEAVVRAVMAETGHSEFAVQAIRDAVAANPNLKSPLTLWGRRLLGEAITQTQYVLAGQEDLTELLFSVETDLNGIAGFFDSIQERHARRMADMGLT
ncbi:UNVERIFIED_CONTAM: tRNA-(MS[2]IO[6]A)-hydroxylase MiaE-like protein [Williamsia faeni]